MMDIPGLSGTVYIILSLALYLLICIILFFSVKSRLRELFLMKCKELFSRLDSGSNLFKMLTKADAAIRKPLMKGISAGLNAISKLSNGIAGRQKWLTGIKFGEAFDVFALILRKLYSPEPFVLLSYSAILFVVFYFILTIF